MYSHRRWTDRLIQLAVALIVIGIITQVAIGYLISLLPFILIGLAVIGVGALVLRRYRQW